MVLRSLKNRVQVTQDAEDKIVLEQAVAEIETEVRPFFVVVVVVVLQ